MAEATSNARRLVRGRSASSRPPSGRASGSPLRGAGGLTAAELIALVWGSGSRGRSAVDLAADALGRHDGLTGLARATDARARGAFPGSARRRRPSWWPRSSSAGGCSPTGRRRAGRSARRATSPTGSSSRWAASSARSCASSCSTRRTSSSASRRSTRATCRRRWSGSAELFRDAVRLNAAGVILVHNHPSGDPTPSPDDLHLTAEALAAGRLLDIDLLDHLVIGHDAWVSLRDRGVAFDRPGRPRPLAG